MSAAIMQTIAPRAGSVPYDPLYDPLKARQLGPRSDYAPTYWIDTAGPAPADGGPVRRDMDVDVAVIGSGYTGLSCALHLAKMHGIKATVLEANGVAEDTIADVDASGLWKGIVVTEVVPVGDFWEAEPDHQDYLEKRPGGYTCHFPRPDWVLPKRREAGDMSPAAGAAAE